MTIQVSKSDSGLFMFIHDCGHLVNSYHESFIPLGSLCQNFGDHFKILPPYVCTIEQLPWKFYSLGLIMSKF